MQKKLRQMLKRISPSDREKEMRGFTQINCRNKGVATQVRKTLGYAAHHHPRNAAIVIVRGQGHARRADKAIDKFPTCKVSKWSLARKDWKPVTIRRLTPEWSMPDPIVIPDQYESYTD